MNADGSIRHRIAKNESNWGRDEILLIGSGRIGATNIMYTLDGVGVGVLMKLPTNDSDGVFDNGREEQTVTTKIITVKSTPDFDFVIIIFLLLTALQV